MHNLHKVATPTINILDVDLLEVDEAISQAVEADVVVDGELVEAMNIVHLNVLLLTPRRLKSQRT